MNLIFSPLNPKDVVSIKRKRRAEAYSRIVGRRSTFYNQTSNNPTPISVKDMTGDADCLFSCKDDEFPTFTIREQTYASVNSICLPQR